MPLLFRSTQVSAPTTPPSLSIGGAGFYIRHRRVNLDGGVSLWSEAVEFLGAAVTITPESYGDASQLLRDEFLYSTDDITYYVIPRTGTLIGAQTVTTFPTGSWAIAVNEDSQNSALTSLNFGTFTSSNSPFKRFYLLNDGLSIGSLTFNFVDALTTEVAANFSGLVQVEIEGVFSQYSQSASTLYNDSFIWQSPPQNLNTLGLVFPANSFLQIKVTLLNFPTGGLIENTISLSMQVQENLRVFPLSYDSNWALDTFLYDPSKGFDYPFIQASNAGLTITVKPFLININGVLIGRFTDTVFTVSELSEYQFTLSNSGVLQIWNAVTDIIPSNLKIIGGVVVTGIAPFISSHYLYISPRPAAFGVGDLSSISAHDIIAYNQGLADYDLALTTADAIGIALSNQKAYATAGITLVTTSDAAIVAGDYLGCFDGEAVPDASGFLRAIQDFYFNYVLCEFRVNGGGASGGDANKVDLDGNNSAFSYVNFTPSAAPAYQEGRVWYDTDTDSISYYDNHTGTSVQVGKELVVTARNDSGAAIANGQVVYISGATGQNPTIALARADSLTTSEIIGVATHDIANNTTGKVTVFGLVNDINTLSFTDGQQVYLSSTTAGLLTATPPASPNFVVFVGYIAHAHVTQGKLLVMSDRAMANDNSLGTSQIAFPTVNSVREFVVSGLSGKQNLDGDLTAIAALSSTGVLQRTGADTWSFLTVGTAANNLVQLDGTGRLPAVDGSQLTNLPGGGALTYFAESIFTAAPNNTVNAIRLIPTGGTTNVGTVIGIKGDGYLSTVVPDTEYSIGNKSIFLSTFDGAIGSPFTVGVGSFAVLTDQPFQGLIVADNSISINSETASGSIGISPILNNGELGYVGAIAEADSVAIGLGAGTNTEGVAVGKGAYAGASSVSVGTVAQSSVNGVAVGYDSLANDSVSIGFGAESSNAGVAIGVLANCTGLNSVGLSAVQEDRNGLISYAKDTIARQALAGIYFADTTNATPTRLENTGGIGGSSIIMSFFGDKTVMSIRAIIVARTSAGLISEWEIEALLKKPTTAASTALVYTPKLKENVNEIGITTLPTVIADTTLGGGVFQVVGLAATTIRWAATIINLVEI